MGDIQENLQNPLHEENRRGDNETASAKPVIFLKEVASTYGLEKFYKIRKLANDDPEKIAKLIGKLWLRLPNMDRNLVKYKSDKLGYAFMYLISKNWGMYEKVTGERHVLMFTLAKRNHKVNFNEYRI